MVCGQCSRNSAIRQNAYEFLLPFIVTMSLYCTVFEVLRYIADLNLLHLYLAPPLGWPHWDVAEVFIFNFVHHKGREKIQNKTRMLYYVAWTQYSIRPNRSAIRNRCFLGLTRVVDANGISIASVVSAGLTRWQIDWQTDRPRYSVGIGGPQSGVAKFCYCLPLQQVFIVAVGSTDRINLSNQQLYSAVSLDGLQCMWRHTTKYSLEESVSHRRTR